MTGLPLVCRRCIHVVRRKISSCTSSARDSERLALWRYRRCRPPCSALPVRCLCFYETRAEPGLRGYVSAVASGDVTRTLAPPTRCAVIRLRNTDTHVIHIPQAFVRTVQVGILKEFDPRGTKDTRRLKAAQSGGLWVLSQLCQRLQRRHPAMLTQCYSKCGCCSARPLASTEMHGCSFTSSLAH